MNPFAWLGDLLERLTAVIPRLLHVICTHGGVMFTRAKVRELKPGMYIYWPIWSRYELYPITRQTLNLPPQFLLCRCSNTVLASVTVVFRIRNITKALVQTYDLEDTIRDCAQGAVRRVLATLSISDIQTSQTEIDKDLRVELRKVLGEPFGIWCEEAFLSDFSPSTVYRIVGDSTQLLPQVINDDEE